MSRKKWNISQVFNNISEDIMKILFLVKVLLYFEVKTYFILLWLAFGSYQLWLQIWKHRKKNKKIDMNVSTKGYQNTNCFKIHLKFHIFSSIFALDLILSIMSHSSAFLPRCHNAERALLKLPLSFLHDFLFPQIHYFQFRFFHSTTKSKGSRILLYNHITFDSQICLRFLWISIWYWFLLC